MTALLQHQFDPRSILAKLCLIVLTLLAFRSNGQYLNNDDCASAVTLTVNAGCVNGSNILGTPVGDETTSCATGDHGVFFSFVATTSNSIVISTDHPNTNFDTQLALFSGTCGSLTEIDCDDNGGTGNTSTISTTGLIPGNTYYIQLNSFGASAGNYCIGITSNDCAPVNSGTFTALKNGNPTSGPINLCIGDCFTYMSNDDFILPEPAPGESSELIYAIYNAPPTAAEPALDPAFIGTYVPQEDLSYCNDGNDFPVGSNLWFVPITADDSDDNGDPNGTLGYDSNLDNCFDMGTPLEVHFLNDFDFTTSLDCNNGIVNITITGGVSDVNGSNYTVTNTGSGNLTGTPVSSGGTIVIDGLTNGQTYSITISDASGCNSTFSGTYNSAPDAGTSGTLNACTNDALVDLFTGLGGTPDQGGNWSDDDNTGALNGQFFNPSLVPSGTYDFTYTIQGAGACPSVTSTVTVVVTGISISVDAINEVTCNGNCDGSVLTTITGGQPPYTAVWTDGLGNVVGNNEDISNLCPGTYNLTVTDNSSTGGTVVVWDEDFEGTPNWTLNTITGTNDNAANRWQINDEEGGVAPSGCGVANNGNATLHVTDSDTWPFAAAFTGAAYYAGGLPGENATTNKRAEYNQPIVTTGLTNLTLSFDWIGNGQAVQDFCTLEYSVDGGTTWNNLNIFQGGNVCPLGQGEWANYSMSLPAACENQADLRFAFNWTNDNDANGTDPSFAVNDMELTTTSGAVNCQQSIAVIITEPQAITLDFTVINDVSCNGGSDGTIAVLADGGTGNLTYSWNTNPVQTGASITGLSSGNYDVTVTDATGCSETFTLTVNEPASPLDLQISSQITITCEGGSDGIATVAASGGNNASYSYTWNTNPAQNSATATGLSEGTYMAYVTDANGCTDSVEVIMIEDPNTLSASISGQIQPTCTGGGTDGELTVTITGGSGNSTISWNTNPVQSTSTITGLSAGQYIVTVTDNVTGCIITDTATLSAPSNNVDVTVTAQTNPSCNGDTDGSITVTGTGGNPSYSYVWNTMPVQTGATASGLADGTYQVIVTDQNGCSDSIQVTLTEPTPLVLNMSNDTTICDNGAASLMANVSGGNGNYNYQWTCDQPDCHFQDSTSASVVAEPNTNTTYTVTITDMMGCTISSVINVTVEPAPIVDAGLDQTIDFGNTAQLNGSTNTPGSVNWTPANTLNNSNNLSPVAEPLQTTTYTLSVTAANGCTGTDQVTIFVEDPEITVPSLFSPNGDGSNDEFEIVGLSAYPDAKVNVYTRWGEEIFTSSSANDYWDGTHKGEMAPMGAYYYVIDLGNGSEPISGTISILK